MKEKRLPLPGTELLIRMDEQQADRIAHSWPYRYGIGPALRWIGRRNNGYHPAAVTVPASYPRSIEWPDRTPEQCALVQEIQGQEWYHTIELGYGVRTPGYFDHGPALRHFPLPQSLRGKRCLDVATFDGFWAFEMERRGADEVVALDIETWLDLDMPPYIIEDFRRRGLDRPTGAGFQIAARLLQSQVDRRICNVYDLSPEKFGRFDLVFCSDLLVHLTNPVRVLQNIYAVTQGEAIIVEPYDPNLNGMGPVASLLGKLDEGRWWAFSRDYLERAIRLAGFAHVELYDEVDIRVRQHRDAPAPRAIFRAFRDARPANPGQNGTHGGE